MRLLKQTLGILGAVVILAVIVAFVAPKRTHALVAALVQIVPGTTTHVGQNESQLVSLYCSFGLGTCASVDSEGHGSATAYVVPSGYTLIVTDWEWFGYNGEAGGLRQDALFNNSNSSAGSDFPESYVIADKNGNAFAHEHYASGIRVASGVTIGDTLAFVSEGTAFIQGYLVPND
jgi:hypothetical protein